MSDFKFSTHESDDKSTTHKEKQKLLKRIKNFFQNPKKRLIFIICSGAMLIIIFGIGIHLMTRDQKLAKVESKNSTNNTEDNTPKFQAPLDGIMTDKTSSEKHPLAIIVENHPESRPQVGLDKASIVYEAIAEGGITRFLAIFGTNEAEKVGPVRSARTYYVDWAHGYDAYLAHVGGNMDALDRIPVDKILDLDQFKYSSPYWREKNGNVSTEHTMFTSTLKLREQAEKNNYNKSNNFNVLKFKDDPEGSEKDALPKNQTVSVNYSSAEYKVSFDYNPATNSYLRSMAGSPHVDKVTKTQLSPKNIIVMTVQRKPTVTRINEPGYIMTTEGSGKAKFFIDGKEISGTWKKSEKDEREMFYDETGSEITFNRGQFWICVIPPEGSISTQ